MNQFINYKKRSVELPAGCKDLIDVLHLAKREASSTFTSQSGRLADVAKHLSALLKPGAKSRNVAITWRQMNYLHLMNEEGGLTALAIVHEDTAREPAVRGVFEAAGIAPILDEAVAGASFVRVLAYPLPSRAPAVEQLISDLLRRGYGLAEDVRLELSWDNDNS